MRIRTVQLLEEPVFALGGEPLTDVRQYLETTVPRLMLVLEPLKVIIEDLPEDHLEMVEVPFSKDPSFGVSFLFLVIK